MCFITSSVSFPVEHELRAERFLNELDQSFPTHRADERGLLAREELIGGTGHQDRIVEWHRVFGGNTVVDPVLEVIREIVGYSDRHDVQAELSSHRSTLHRGLDQGR